MKNKTLLFLLLIFCFHLKSQDSTIAIVYGKEIKKESALIIGYPANSNEYSYISKYYFDNNFQKDVLSPMRENQASDTIYAIHNTDENGKEYLFAANVKKLKLKNVLKLQGYYIDIEPALKYGEIVLNYPAPQNHNWLNDTTFLIAYGKVTGNKDAKLLETYMIKVHNELYEKTKEDEFEFKGALNNVTAEYMSAIDHFDTNKIYSIKSDFLFFSSYDFKNNSLPIQWTVTSLQSVVNINGYYDRSIDLVLLNSNSFSNLSISQENANMLIKRRKDEFGSVNRKLYSVINFKVTSKGLQKDYKAIPANITSIDCYEYDNYEYNYLGTIEPK